jgi:hypothetical protein
MTWMAALIVLIIAVSWVLSFLALRLIFIPSDPLGTPEDKPQHPRRRRLGL